MGAHSTAARHHQRLTGSSKQEGFVFWLLALLVCTVLVVRPYDNFAQKQQDLGTTHSCERWTSSGVCVSYKKGWSSFSQCLAKGGCLHRIFATLSIRCLRVCVCIGKQGATNCFSIVLSVERQRRGTSASKNLIPEPYRKTWLCLVFNCPVVFFASRCCEVLRCCFAGPLNWRLTEEAGRKSGLKLWVKGNTIINSRAFGKVCCKELFKFQFQIANLKMKYSFGCVGSFIYYSHGWEVLSYRACVLNRQISIGNLAESSSLLMTNVFSYKGRTC